MLQLLLLLLRLHALTKRLPQLRLTGRRCSFRQRLRLRTRLGRDHGYVAQLFSQLVLWHAIDAARCNVLDKFLLALNRPLTRYKPSSLAPHLLAHFLGQVTLAKKRRTFNKAYI